jgi:hypothetical protein
VGNTVLQVIGGNAVDAALEAADWKRAGTARCNTCRNWPTA